MPAVGDAHYCAWWQAKVGPEIKPLPTAQASTPETAAADQELVAEADAQISDPDHVAELTDQQVISAIGCLLQLEKDNRESKFGSGPRVSQVNQGFAPAPVKLEALLYISYLFTRNLYLFNFAALRGPGAQSRKSRWVYVTSDRAISKAYVSYRRWYDHVKQIGLASAREQKLNPLEGTGLRWY